MLDFRLTEVLERFMGGFGEMRVMLKVFLGHSLLELPGFLLVLLDLLLLLDKEFLKRIAPLPQILFLIVGVLVLDGLLELGFEDDELVVGLVFFFLDFFVEILKVLELVLE